MEKLSDVIKQVIKDFEECRGCYRRFCEYYGRLSTMLKVSKPCGFLSEGRLLCPCYTTQPVLDYNCGTAYCVEREEIIADLKANFKVVLKIEKDNPNVVIT